MRVCSTRDIGLLVRAKRTEKGWTQADLARSLGCTQRWISEIEGGKATAEIGMVLRTLAMLGIRLEVAQNVGPQTPKATALVPDLPTLADLDAILDGSGYRR
jgi:y4mF family transcriptional regulator